MVFIHGGRASGKTTILIKHSSHTGIPILTTHRRFAVMYKERAAELVLKIPEPLVWKNCRLPVEYGSKVIIDMAENFMDLVLMSTCGVRCEMMAIEDPIKHLTHCFQTEAVGKLPEYYQKGQLENLDYNIYCCGDWRAVDGTAED